VTDTLIERVPLRSQSPGTLDVAPDENTKFRYKVFSFHHCLPALFYSDKHRDLPRPWFTLPVVQKFRE